MSDTVFCPHCAATTGAQIPLPVIITPIRGGVHVESYRPCPECNRTVSYDQITEPEEPETVLTGYYVEWHYNDGERSRHGSREFSADEYEEAAAYRDRMADADTVAYLWPIETEIKSPAECCELALHRHHMIADYDCGVFATDKRLLEDAIKELITSLEGAGRDWERATADDLLATLQFVEDKEDLEASGIKGDLLQIQRRLAG